MPAWNPAMPWPSSTPGGAWSPHWGGYVKLWVRAAIAPGTTWHIGPHPNDKLTAGNVIGGGQPVTGVLAGGTVPNRLWVDLSCDVIGLDISGGASSAQGMLSKPDTAVVQVELNDPEGKYDPTNPRGPFTYGGTSRLLPGVPFQVFAEVVNAATGVVTSYPLFTGTVDSWNEDWVADPSARRAKVTACDATYAWVRYDQPEQPPQGANDTTAQRVARLVSYFGWPGVVEPAASSTVTLQATTLAQSGWELLTRTLDDELGYVYFTPAGHLRWLNRAAWTTLGAAYLALGCGPGLRDVLVDVSPSAVDYDIRNAVYAARTGGTQQTVISQASINRFGRYDYSRTDLDVADDGQALAWAQAVLTQYSYPTVAVEDVTLRPALDPSSWELYALVLALRYVTDLLQIVWAPPDHPENVVDGLLRVVGHSHRITYATWETRYMTAAATSLRTSAILTLGPDPQDLLDAGYILG